jgi:hypothetical protein
MFMSLILLICSDQYKICLGSQHSYGHCAAFAEAMHELTGLQPAALLAVQFSPLFEGTRRTESGFFHSVVLHPHGTGGDGWGKAPVEAIASRFG